MAVESLRTLGFSIRVLDTPNQIIGDDQNNVLVGTSGNDYFDGQGGTDRLKAIADVDFTASEGSVQGLGDDTFINIEIVQLFGGESANTLDASSLVTTRAFLYGREGDDILLGGAAKDKLRGDAGNDSITGGDGRDNLQGGQGDDILLGGAANDRLTGDAGADSLTGGLGKDKLYLGQNDGTIDTVNYNNGDGIDTVFHFVRGSGGDVINFSGISEIDIQVVGDHTKFRVADTNFGTGDLLITLRDVNELSSTNVGINLIGATFNFA